MLSSSNNNNISKRIDPMECLTHLVENIMVGKGVAVVVVFNVYFVVVVESSGEKNAINQYHLCFALFVFLTSAMLWNSLLLHIFFSTLREAY